MNGHHPLWGISPPKPAQRATKQNQKRNSTEYSPLHKAEQYSRNQTSPHGTLYIQPFVVIAETNANAEHR
jgi:hypothetical protein